MVARELVLNLQIVCLTLLTPNSYLHERGFSLLATSYLELALDLSEACRARGSSPYLTDLLSDVHYTLGAIANGTNDALGTLKHNTILLEMRKDAARLAGKNDVRLAAAFNQIGVGYMMFKKHTLAQKSFEDSIATYRTLDDFDVDVLAFPMANLGSAQWVQGDLDGAARTLMTALRDREERFGSEDKVSYK